MPLTATQQRIVTTARSFLGQREIQGNKGFQSKDFQRKMVEVGFISGHSWCAYFTELVWKEAFGKTHQRFAEFDRLFSASAVATFSNFRNHPNYRNGTTPRVGALAVWRYGNGWQGHIGVVVDVIQGTNQFVTIEGNTNSSGSREGIEVAQRTRRTGLPNSAKGLNLIGFIYAPEA